LLTKVIQVHEGRTHINFPVQEAPPGQLYYVKFTTNQGEVEVFGRNEDNYIHGTAFIEDQPIEGDIAFQATYDYDWQAVSEDIFQLLARWNWLLPLAILLLLPGWLLLDITHWKDQFDLGERLAMALGLSLSIIPILMIWTTLAGLSWGRISVWVVTGVLVILQAIRWLQASQKSSLENSGKEAFQFSRTKSEQKNENPVFENEQSSDSYLKRFSTPEFRNTLTNGILMAIFGFALVLRFAMVRDLAAPAWVDSIHHGVITRLILENGGLVESFYPFIPPGAEHYHFGFHSNLAALVWLTNLEIHTGMQFFGQVLNAFIVFPIYLLAKKLTGSRPAGLTAALVVTAFILMPAYYASWGRYTHLTGLLVLPAAFISITKLLEAKNLKEVPKKDWGLAAIILAGLFLIHYRVAAFLILLLLAFLLIEVQPKKWMNSIARLLLLGLIMFGILLPWFPKAFAELLLPTGLRTGSGQYELSGIPWNFLEPAWGELALVLAGVGLLLGLLSLKRFPFTVVLWSGFMYLLANLRVFSLPGAGFVNPVAMEITLFMPIAILAGFAIGGILHWYDYFVPENWHILPRIILLPLGIWFSLFGAQRLLPTLNPITFLAREVDFPAIEWIDEYLPGGEPILINAAPWGYGVYMGYDGGYWISALTNHPTIPPPVLYGMGDPIKVQEINQAAEDSRNAGENPEALWDLLQTEQVRYVYTGGRGGAISPQALSQSNLFQVRFHENGTWVFEIISNK
jgi:hypothetical protein